MLIIGKNIKKEMNEDERENPSSAAQVSEVPSTLDTPTAIRFVYGNPSVETFEGVLHLYKDNQFVYSFQYAP